MGEYARKGDESVKLGTCESLFYVSRMDIMALDMDGWRDDHGRGLATTYLGESAFRVLLPDWDTPAGDIHAIASRDHAKPKKVYRISLPPEAAPAVAEVDHARLYFSRHNTNFWVECPYGKNPPAKGTHSAIQPLSCDLIEEGVGDRPRAVYRCPYCEAKFNMRGHDLQPLFLEAFREQWKPRTGRVIIPNFEFEYLEALVAAGMPTPAPDSVNGLRAALA